MKTAHPQICSLRRYGLWAGAGLLAGLGLWGLIESSPSAGPAIAAGASRPSAAVRPEAMPPAADSVLIEPELPRPATQSAPGDELDGAAETPREAVINPAATTNEAWLSDPRVAELLVTEPEFRAAWRKVRDAQVDANYGPWLDSFGLDPAPLASVREVLAERLALRREWQAAGGDAAGPSSATEVNVLAQLRTELEATVLAQLGPDFIKTLIEYEAISARAGPIHPPPILGDDPAVQAAWAVLARHLASPAGVASAPGE